MSSTYTNYNTLPSYAESMSSNRRSTSFTVPTNNSSHATFHKPPTYTTAAYTSPYNRQDYSSYRRPTRESEIVCCCNIL